MGLPHTPFLTVIASIPLYRQSYYNILLLFRYKADLAVDLAEGLIEKDATVVSVVTGNGLKDVANAIKSAGEPLHIEPDLDLMVKGFAERGVTVE